MGAVKRLAVVTVLCSLAACAHFDNGKRDAHGRAIRASLDRDVPRLLAENHVPSVSIARIESGRLIFTAAYGEQSHGVPATTKTLYNIASMTKPISAEVVLRLVSQGRIGLDEPMYPYWIDPDIANDERSKLLTPRLMLSHQSGFPNWRRQTGGVLAFKQTPGTAFGYSGEGYEYVARFAEKKTGENFEALAQNLVFGPVEMSETAYTGRPWFEGRIAEPADASGAPLKPVIAKTWVASDLLYTTPTDYAKFMLSVLGKEGVTPAVAAERSRIQISRKRDECAKLKPEICPDDLGFGLGWEVFRFRDATYLMHTGKDDGLFTLGYLDITHGSGTIIFTSGENGASLVLPILDDIGAEREFVDLLRAQGG
jgi:CubicO group peptidase (beta-lactamase class C family)